MAGSTPSPQTTGMFNAYMNPEQLRQKSFASTIARIFPNGTAPLFALTGQAGRARAKDIKHGYFSKTWGFRNLKLAAGNNTVTSLDLAEGSTAGILVNSLWHNVRTRELIRITGITDGNTLAFTRSFGSVDASAIQATDQWINVGSAHKQGSARPQAKSVQAEWFENFTQIWRNAWALTDTARASLSEAGWTNVAEGRQDAMMFHSQDIEMSMFFGQKSFSNAGNEILTSTQGVIDAIYEYAPSNVKSAGATTNFDQFEDMLTPAFEFNTTGVSAADRILFTDSKGNKVINQIGRNHAQAQMTLDQTEMGQSFTTIKTFKGRVHVVEHPQFNGHGLEGVAVVLDLPSIKLAYMDGRETKSEEYGVGGAAQGVQGIDAVGGSLTSEAAVEFLSPFSCAVINGLTEGVA